MYHIEDHRCLINSSAGELIRILQKYPENATVLLNGDNIMWMHVDYEEDDTTVASINFDESSEEDMYEEYIEPGIHVETDEEVQSYCETAGHFPDENIKL